MLLILLKKIIQHGNYESMKDNKYEISQDDYKKIIQLNLIIAEELNKKHLREFDKDHFLYSTYHLNYQRNVAHEFLRMYYMMEKIGRDKNNFDIDIKNEYRDYYADFSSKYGFTPTQYSSLLFWELNTYYLDVNGLIYRKMWKDIKSVYGEVKEKELAKKIISTISSPLDNYLVWTKESENQEWNFNEFFKFPFIADAEGNYISICDITLRNAFFEKIFWLIRECYPQKDRPMSFFGRLFEKYIQNLTQDVTKGDYEYIAEFQYGKKNIKSSDVYIKKDKNLLAVEAKGFSVLIDCMAKNESIEKNNNKMFVNPVTQADLFLSKILDVKSEFIGIETVYIISVTMDSINAVPNFYNSVYKIIEAEKKCTKVKYYFNFSIEEYEMIIYLAENKVDIFSILKGYYENEKLKPFSNYLNAKYPNIGMSSFMENIYQAACEEMKKMLLV